MKVLSIRQPWASLIASGEKRIETRSWQTKYRGTIAIHYSGKFDAEAKEHLYFLQVGFDCLKDLVGDLPTGCIIATANLYDIKSTSWTCEYGNSPWVSLLAEKEHAMGDFSNGRFGWFLNDVKMLDTSIPCKGQLGLWETELI